MGLLRGAGRDARVAVVWIHMLPSDNEAAARRARALLDDPRVTHFHDPDRHAGRSWSGPLDLASTAWDVYLLFDGRGGWRDPAPGPDAWFHQLGGEGDPERYRTGHSLAASLYHAGAELGWPVAPEPPHAEQWPGARRSALSGLQAAAGSREDPRCPACRAQGPPAPCSFGAARRLLMRRDGRTGMISPAEPAGDPGEHHVVSLAVTGMGCTRCMLRAGAPLLAMKAVREVEVRLDEARIRVLMSSSQEHSNDALAAAVRSQGFGAKVIRRPHPP